MLNAECWMLDAGCFVARAVFQTSGYLRPGADDKSEQDRRNKEGKRRVADGLSSARGGPCRLQSHMMSLGRPQYFVKKQDSSELPLNIS